MTRILPQSFLQGKEEGDSFPRSAFGGDLSFVEIDPVLDDGQAQSGSPNLAAPSFIYPVKTLEDAIDVFFRNPRSVVGEAEIVIFGVFFVAVHRDFDVLSGVSDRVVVQVSEDGIEQGGVPDDGRVSWKDYFRGDMFFLHFLGALFLDFRDQLGDVDLGQLEHLRSLVQPVEHGDVP